MIVTILKIKTKLNQYDDNDDDGLADSLHNVWLRKLV